MVSLDFLFHALGPGLSTVQRDFKYMVLYNLFLFLVYDSMIDCVISKLALAYCLCSRPPVVRVIPYLENCLRIHVQEVNDTALYLFTLTPERTQNHTKIPLLKAHIIMLLTSLVFEN